MPELPDIAVYLESLERRIRGARLLLSRLLKKSWPRPLDELDG